MADLLSAVKELSKPSGLLAPNQLKTVQGPGTRLDNRFDSKPPAKSSELNMGGHGLKGKT